MMDRRKQFKEAMERLDTLEKIYMMIVTPKVSISASITST
jgi:hypothetical protein